MRLSERFLHSIMNHNYNRIEMAQKKVRELKNRGKLQRKIWLLLRELTQNNYLTKIMRKLEI